ncbi:L,D-transpeptidase family protein [Streptomyces sp. NPDC050738]|uniref:L,D-transpeptidase family protein n=1 Tax=Streptomyces sp. NPDC050738 TaxID=3154744 RepID=UPI0034439F23
MIKNIAPRRGAGILLALAAVLPLGTSAHADPVPPPAPAPMRLFALPRLLDTPDEALPPRVYTPSAAEDAIVPAAPPAGADALVEAVPKAVAEAVPGLPAASAVPTAPDEAPAGSAARACTRSTGPYQRQVEKWLKLRVDGRQSAADCAAIRRFQRQQHIRPDIGYAGPVTWGRMQAISARLHPNAAGKCPVRKYKVACVDLSRQLMWVQKGKKVVFGPAPVRTGRAVHPTRTGWFKVYWKHKNHWSSLYNSPMPYSQFFSGGQAFHGIYASVYNNPPGSHGCVNMRYRDAQRLWSVLGRGDAVYIWGRKPAV